GGPRTRRFRLRLGSLVEPAVAGLGLADAVPRAAPRRERHEDDHQRVRPPGRPARRAEEHALRLDACLHPAWNRRHPDVRSEQGTLDRPAEPGAPQMTQYHTYDALIDLERMGLPFNRTPDGKIDQRRFGGHTRNHGESPVKRACYAADRTGHMILQTLFQQCTKQGVEFFDEYYVLDLILSEDRVAGLVAIQLATGELHVFHTKKVLFATGGYGRVYKVTSNAHALTGDGPGVILRRGLPLEDMEFFQFHPTGIYGIGILLSEAARGEGGIIRNANGERFMERYAPTIKDLAPRHMVSRANYCVIKEGRGAGPNKDY